MGERGFGYEDLLQVVDLVEKSRGFAEFRLKIGEIEVHIQNKVQKAVDAAPPSAPEHGLDVSNAPAADHGVHDASDSASQTAPAKGIVPIKSPMVGTFYRSPEPGAPPFVEIGSRVTPDTTVCIVEVMKLMNSLHAGVAGVVVEIAAQDAEPVEFGQILLAIDTMQ